MCRNSGEVATGILVAACVIVGLFAHALGSGKVQAPNFKAQEKTVDTLVYPAPPEWDR